MRLPIPLINLRTSSFIVFYNAFRHEIHLLLFPKSVLFGHIDRAHHPQGLLSPWAEPVCHYTWAG